MHRSRPFLKVLGLVTTAFLAAGTVAFASDVDVAVVDVTAPTNSVSLAAGGSGNITINMSVTGNQAGTATFEVYRNWTLTGGSFTGSNPQEFTVGPRTGGAPATTFSTTGTVSVAAGQGAGIFALAVGAFDVTNSNATGAKLAVGDSSNYQVTVSAPPPSDTTPPVITPNVSGMLGNNGWYVSDATVSWNVVDGQSATSSSSGCDPTTISSDTTGMTLTCTATSSGGTASQSVTIMRDATAPVVVCAAADGIWHAADVSIPCTASDVTSGLAVPADAAFNLVTSVAAGTETSNASTDSRSISDQAGNSAQAGPVAGNMVDKKGPTGIAFVGSISDGDSYYFGTVPAAPTCSASDGGSGLASCLVSGYSTAVGEHTLTATATDMVGNFSTTEISYTVLAWNLFGFYQPVDMNGVFNTVKGGSTVPLKFEVFAGAELTSTSVVKSFVPTRIACDSSASFDDVELSTSGGTSLRYDTTAGQFIQNWQTPKQAGACYRVTMTTQDGSSLVAFFRLK